MRGSIRWVVAVMTLLCMVGVMASGCAKKEAGQEAPKAKKHTIGVSLASATNPLYVQMEKGIRDQAQELGVDLKVVVAEEDQSKQINGIQDLIVSKVDAILVSPITIEGATVAYENAKKAGIPVVSIARSLGKPDLEACFVGLSWTECGKTIGEWIAKKLNGKGKVAMLKGPAGASVSIEMEKGVKEVFSKYPDIKIVAEMNQSLTKEAGLNHAQNVLTANPDLSAIYCMNDELALGAVQAAEAAGKVSSIVITGFNGTPPAVEAVKAGKMGMTIGLKPYSWGKLGVRTVIDLLNGKKLPYLVPSEKIVIDQSNANQLTPDQLK